MQQVTANEMMKKCHVYPMRTRYTYKTYVGAYTDEGKYVVRRYDRDGEFEAAYVYTPTTIEQKSVDFCFQCRRFIVFDDEVFYSHVTVVDLLDEDSDEDMDEEEYLEKKLMLEHDDYFVAHGHAATVAGCVYPKPHTHYNNAFTCKMFGEFVEFNNDALFALSMCSNRNVLIVECNPVAFEDDYGNKVECVPPALFASDLIPGSDRPTVETRCWDDIRRDWGCGARDGVGCSCNKAKRSQADGDAIGQTSGGHKKGDGPPKMEVEDAETIEEIKEELRKVLVDAAEDTSNSIVAYWNEDEKRGVSVQSLGKIANALSKAFGGGDVGLGFKMARAVYNRVDTSRVDKIVEKSLKEAREKVAAYGGDPDNRAYPDDEKLSEMLAKAGIKIFHGGEYIRRPTYKPFSALVAPLLGKAVVQEIIDTYLENFKFPFKDEMLDVFSKDDDHLIRFVASYRITPPDTDWLASRLDARSFSNYPEPYKTMVATAAARVLNGVLRMAITFTMSNGSAAAQIGRIKADTDLHRALLTPTKHVSYDKAYLAKYAEMVPLHPAPQLDWDQITDVVSWAAAREASDKPTELLSFHKHSSPGVMASKGVKIGNIIPQIMFLANTIMDAVVEEKFDAIKVFTVSECKPKDEAIEVEKDLSKIRNIYVPPTAGQLPFNMLLRSSKPINVINQIRQSHLLAVNDDHMIKRELRKVTARNFLGVNFFSLGLNDLMVFIKSHLRLFPDEPLFFVYSDNLYLALVYTDKETKRQRMVWISADGKSFQCQSTRANARRVRTRYLKHNGVPEDHKISQYTKWWESTAVDAPTVMGKYQFDVPGLVSGTAATSAVNTQRMCELITDWEEDGKPQVVVPDKSAKSGFSWTGKMSNLMRKNGFNLSIETAVHLESASLTSKFGRLWNLDLLGFSALEVVVRARSYTIAILEESKIYKAITFNRLLGRRALSKVQLLSARLMKFRVLYLIGGAFYQDLSLILQNLCAAAMDQLVDSFDPGVLEEVFEQLGADLEVTAMSAEDKSVITSAFSKAAVPTPYEVMVFHLGEHVAELWAEDVAARTGSLIIPMAGIPLDIGLPTSQLSAPTPIAAELTSKTAKAKVVDTNEDVPSDSIGALSGSGIDSLDIDSRKPTVTNKRVQAITDVLRGAFNSRQAYDELTLAEKLAAVKAAEGVVSAAAKNAPTMFYLGTTKDDFKRNKFDLAGLISRMTKINLYAVLSVLEAYMKTHPVHNKVIKGWDTEDGYRNYKLALTAAILGNREYSKEVEDFITQNYDSLKTGNLDWAAYDDLDILVSDGKLRRQLLTALEKRQLKFRPQMAIGDDDDDDSDPLPPPAGDPPPSRRVAKVLERNTNDDDDDER